MLGGTFEVLSHCQTSASSQDSHSRTNNDLLQYLRESGLIHFHKLLQLVQVITEQAEAFVECDIA